MEKGESSYSIMTIGLGLAHAFLVLCASGCNSINRTPVRDYSTLPADQLIEFEEARALTAKGSQAFESQHLEKAEKHFRDALQSSTNYGPAHYNLAQVYLARQELYLAAWEFELAANLMPDRIEPILGQGLVYEVARRFEQAELYYRQAYELDPKHREAIGNLARVAIKMDGDPDEIRFLLNELVFYDQRPDWAAWAEELLATKYHGSPILDASDRLTDRGRTMESSDALSGRMPDQRKPGVYEDLPAPAATRNADTNTPLPNALDPPLNLPLLDKILPYPG
jgi:tetratricopeptide (TPR) repeat protein